MLGWRPGGCFAAVGPVFAWSCGDVTPLLGNAVTFDDDVAQEVLYQSVRQVSSFVDCRLYVSLHVRFEMQAHNGLMHCGRGSVLEFCLESPLNSHVNVILVQCYLFFCACFLFFFLW